MSKFPSVPRFLCAAVLTLAAIGVRAAGEPKDPATPLPISDAIKNLQDKVKANPEDLEARRQLAASLAKARRWDDAAVEAKGLMDRQPGDKIAWAIAGEADIRRERWKDGADELEKAHSLGFDDPVSFLELSEAYTALGKYYQAEKLLEYAVIKDPKDAGALADFGNLRLKQKRIQESDDFSQRALKNDPANVTALMTLADNSLTRKQPTDAIGYANRALEADPLFWRALGVIGLAEEQRDNVAAALAAYKKAARISPRQYVAWQGIARISPDYAESLAAAQTGAGLAPDDAAAQALPGITQQRFEKYDEAIASFLEVLAAHPENEVAAGELNALLMSSGRAGEALDYFMKLTRDRPDWQPAWRFLGRDCLSIGRFAEAEKILKKAIDLDSRDAAAWSDLSATLASLAGQEDSVGRGVEAEKAARRALELDPENISALLRLSMALVAQHKFTDAEDLCQRALQLDGRSAEGWLLLAKIRFTRGNHDKALEAFEAAIRIAPMETQYWKELQEGYQRLKNTAGGERKVKQLLLEFPKSASGWVSLGILLSSQQKYPESIEAFQKSLALKLANADAWNGMGVAQANQNKVPEALESFQKAVQTLPGYSEAWSNIGYMYMLEGKLPEAIENCQRALKINPRNTLALANLAQAAAKNGDMDLAKKTCDELAEINPSYADSLRAQIVK